MNMKAKKRFFWRTAFAIQFIRAIFLYVLLLVFVNFYATWSIIRELEYTLHYSSAWKTNFILSQICFLGVAIILFMSLTLILHRSLGPIPRVERVMDEIIKGNYSLRVSIRQKDFLQSFINKLNKIISLLESESRPKS